jgi:hypothetical protein
VPFGSTTCAAARVVRTARNGFAWWGAGVHVGVNSTQQENCPYDASRYGGISFYAKGTGTVTVSVATSPTVPLNAGGTCTVSCFDYYAVYIDLTDSWVPYEIPWEELAQDGWGTPVDFSPAEVMYFEFEFGENVDFDLYVDDLSFF